MKFDTKEDQSAAFKKFYKDMSRDFEDLKLALQRDVGYLRTAGVLKPGGPPESVEAWEREVQIQIERFIKRREKILNSHTELVSRPDRKKGTISHELILITLDARDDFKKYVVMFAVFLKVPFIDEVDKKLLNKTEALSELILQEYLDKNLNLDYAVFGTLILRGCGSLV